MFNDIPLKAGLAGLKIDGLGLTKTGVMTLALAAGSVDRHNDGGVFSLGASQSHTFVADSALPTEVFMGLISNGVDTDLWVDVYVDDGLTVRGDPPQGHELVLEAAWFTIPAAEVNLDNVSMNRRVWE